MAFILHDITARKEMEQKLLRSERFASIGELAGMLGHDLRNPLSGIRGATYYLRKKLAKHLDAEDVAMFESIDQSINYSNKIINDLLEYSTEIKLNRQLSRLNLDSGFFVFYLPPENVKVIDETPDVPKFKLMKIKSIAPSLTS